MYFSGVHFLTTARSSLMKYTVVTEAGLMDPTLIIYSPAIKISYNVHTMENLLITGNEHDGMEIMKNDVYTNAAIRHSVISNNLGTGVSVRGSFFTVENCTFIENVKAGFEYNPHYTTYEAFQIRAGIMEPHILNENLNSIHLDNEGREFVITQQTAESMGETFQVEIECNSEHRVVLDLIDYNPDTATENVTVFDGPISGIGPNTRRWMIEDDLVDFPIESSARFLTVRWVVNGIATGRFAFVVRSSMLMIRNKRRSKNTCNVLGPHLNKYLKFVAVGKKTKQRNQYTCTNVYRIMCYKRENV